MPFQPVPDVAQIRIIGNSDQQLTINNLYFQISGGGITPTNIQDIVGEMVTWASGSLAPQLAETWVLTNVTGTDLSAVDGAYYELPQNVPGGVATESSPNNVAACISLRTAQRGRSFRGRNYLPGIPNAAIDLNTLNGTFTSNMTLIYNALVGPGTFLPGWQFVIVSRQNAGLVRPAGLAVPVVSCGFTNNYVRSMRSREIGHGA